MSEPRVNDAYLTTLAGPLRPYDRVYLAARYSKREVLCGYRREIEDFGAKVTSRWLNGDHQLDDRGRPIYEDGTLVLDEDGSAQAPDAARLRFAQEDAADVLLASVLIAFTEEPRATNSRGGRHVELGMALGVLAANREWRDSSLHHFGPPMRRVIVVGPRENVFTWLPEVEWAPSWEAARPLLLPELIGPTEGGDRG